MYSNEVSARIGSDKGPPRCTQKRNQISGAVSGAANTACMSAPLLEVQFWDGGSTTLSTSLISLIICPKDI